MRAQAAAAADLLARDLELQRAQTQWVRSSNLAFPDLGRIGQVLMRPGFCLAYRDPKGAVAQRLCQGLADDAAEPPRAFARVYADLFGIGAQSVRELAHGGAAVVSIEPSLIAGQAWRTTSRAFGLGLAGLAALSLLVYAALARALRPTRGIAAALRRLSAGDLGTRVPAFDLAELSAVGEVFNHLAASLQHALDERNGLTRRLIAVQDEERLHLARELHDEFGQCLAAIRAVAATAAETAGENSDVAADCDRIDTTAAHLMDVLRGTLTRLRPPDVEAIGLAGSLESLVAAWNARLRVGPRFEIEVVDRFDRLPALFGASLYRVAQEAITNAAKHADASHVRLRLERRSGAVALIVEDDGKANGSDLTAKTGLGLAGMRERVAALGGALDWRRREPCGSVLSAVIPAQDAVAA